MGTNSHLVHIFCSAHLPMVKDGEAEGLTRRVVAQVCLKAEALKHGKEVASHVGFSAESAILP